jgi:hypothetical protein
MVGTNQIMGEKYKPEWSIISESIQGASHERSGQPNQDAIAHFPTLSDSL